MTWGLESTRECRGRASLGDQKPRTMATETGGLNAGLIHLTDSKFKAAEPHTSKKSINLWSLLKRVQHGLMEKALTSTAFSALHLQPDMQRHWFLSLFSLTGNSTGQSTGIPVCAAMVTWVTALRGGSHQGFYRGWTETRDACMGTKRCTKRA